MKIRHSIFILTFIVPFYLVGKQPFLLQYQNVFLDSLQMAWQSTDNDTLKVQLAEDLARHYLELDRDSALYYCEQWYALSMNTGHKIAAASAYSSKGYVYYHMGEYIDALNTFHIAMRLAEDVKSEDIPPFFLQDTVYDPQYHRLSTLAHINHNLGHLYGGTDNFDKQIASYQKTVTIAESLNYSYLLSLVHMNMGHAYYLKKQLDTALYHEQLALHYADKSGIIDYKGVIVTVIGNIIFDKQGLDQASKYFLEGIQISKDLNKFLPLAQGYYSFAYALMEENRLDSGLFFARNAFKIYQSLDEQKGLMKTSSLLSSALKQKNKPDSALYYLEWAMKIKDNLNHATKIKQFENIGFNELLRVQELENEKAQYRSRIRIYALLAFMFVILFIAFLLFRINRNRRKANKLLRHQRNELQSTLAELNNTQAQLIHSEKMASLGELTAGIAHEIQNPLNFVNNFSEVSVDLIEEMNEEMETGSAEDAKTIGEDLKENLEKISHHGKRASSIVKGMLEHSRFGDGKKELTNINQMADEYLRLAYHGLRAKDKSFNAEIITEFDDNLPKTNVIPQDFGRVLLNLVNNAFYACAERNQSALAEKQKIQKEGYKPTVIVGTKKIGNDVEIRVKDNGNGIPDEVMKKIFQPFFTTKPTGEGTGLGLSMSYDIITKGHGGKLEVETKEGEGTTFIINIPIL